MSKRMFHKSFANGHIEYAGATPNTRPDHVGSMQKVWLNATHEYRTMKATLANVKSGRTTGSKRCDSLLRDFSGKPKTNPLGDLS